MNIPSYVLRPICGLLTFSMTALAVPLQPFADAWNESAAKRAKELKDAPKPAMTRALTLAEMRSLKGKTGKNPYAAGSAKYAPQYKGVDLLTGNFSTSATDMSFEGGYGIPVNVTRSYSSNNADEGPLGEGWNLSVDLRSTAGGLLKSSGAPVRMVPVEMQERPRNQTRPGALGPDVPIDANATAAPIEAVIATTASGEEVTLQKDVDGIITPPSWDQNEYENTYENVIRDSGTEVPNVYRVLKTQIVKTPEGTIYNYAKMGKYVYGVTKYDSPALTSLSANTEPSNILKITKATDRHGNETTYTYSISSWSEPVYLGGTGGQPSGIPQLTSTSQDDYAIFKKSNGYVVEAKLLNIQMQPDREIDFEWGTYGVPYNRISRAKDNGAGGDQRVVKYAYTNGNLTSFKSAEDYETSYGYDSALMLNSITDTRGMTTALFYADQVSTPLAGPARVVKEILSPQGNLTRYRYSGRLQSDSQIASVTEFEGIPAHDLPEDPDIDPISYVSHCSIEFTESTIVIEASSGGTALDENYGGVNGYETIHTKQTYDRSSNNLISSETKVPRRYQTNNYSLSEQKVVNRAWSNYAMLFADPSVFQYTVENKTYNYFGNPLSQTGYESLMQWGNTLSSRTNSVKYSYWGREKYYQQKAVWSVDADRYSFTDYFTRDAADGLKGQTRAVYSQGLDSTNNNATKFNPALTPWLLDEGFTQDYVNTIVQADRWRYSHPPLQQEANTDPIAPVNVINTSTLPIPSAMFNYDEKGRATEVYKLSKITSGTPTYVKTISEYDATYPTHGVAWKVTEAAGTSSERITKTLAMDLAGRATRVMDANGREFATTYDRDGRTLSVELIVDNNWSPISSTTYGPASPRSVTSGVPIQTDSISNQSSLTIYITYGPPSTTDPGSYGQVTEVAKMGLVSSVAKYKYDQLGNRTESRVTSGGGDQVVKYKDYIAVGAPLQQSYAYQTMIRMEEGTYPNVLFTPEEFHYLYDSSGRILETAFAQTPQTEYANLDGGTVNNNSSWYDDQTGTTRLAQSRARTVYNYDEGGRLSVLETFWDTVNGNSYNSTSIRKAAYTYEKTGKNRGLKTSYKLYKDGSMTASVNEEYQYDPNLDYLTQAKYVDNSNQTLNWTYDASGNRAGAGYVYDELNQMVESPGYTYAHDTVGNRKTKSGSGGETKFYWDEQNRLTATSTGGANDWSANYFYQADGLRYMKVIDIVTEDTKDDSSFLDGNYLINKPTTSYYYDGQMGVGEEYIYTYQGGTAVDWAQNLIGPRGIEMQSTNKREEGWNHQYPLYDGHGNMVCNLKINRVFANGTYSNANVAGTSSTHPTSGDRKYDVWGAVRGGNTTGYPNNRYCANLGHVVDDELGLIYMRARYYEPGTGRFISEDSAYDGGNWYVYCSNSPVNFLDSDGKKITGNKDYYNVMMGIGLLAFFGAGVSAFEIGGPASPAMLAQACALLALSAYCLGEAINQTSFSIGRAGAVLTGIATFAGAIAAMVIVAKKGLTNGFTSVAVGAALLYNLLVIGTLCQGDM